MNSRIIGATALCVAFVASGAFAQDFCNASHSGSKKTVSFSVGAGSDKGETGDIGQYHYEQWNKSGSATTDFYDDGSFSCTFSNTDDFLCREGLFYGQNSGKDPLSVGNLVADYSMKTFTNDKSISYAYAGIYGWMQNPLIEWYIVDNWGPASRPNWLGTSRGKITVDGAEYEIFTASANRATIEGNKAFDQIYSLRSEARTCGTISITEHFKAWKEKGITLGSSLYEAKVLGEAGQYPEQQGASGKIDFNYAKVYVSDGKPTQSSSSAAEESSSSQEQKPTSSAPASSSDAASSSSVAPASSSDAASSSSVAPASSSDIAQSSSSAVPPDALPADVKTFGMAGTYQVFDMQGRFLGKVELVSGSSLKEVVGSKFTRSSVYMVKRGSYAKTIAVER